MDLRVIEARRVILPTTMMSNNKMKKLRRRSIPCVAVLTRQAESGVMEETRKTNTVYSDNWFDKIAIDHLSQAVQATSGFFFFFFWKVWGGGGGKKANIEYHDMQVGKAKRVDMRACWK